QEGELRQQSAARNEPAAHRDEAPTLPVGASRLRASVIATPAENRTSAPDSATSSRRALRTPLSSFTSTGWSETIWPLRMSISASGKCASKPLEGFSEKLCASRSCSALVL